MIGKTISHYKVLEKIGQGGMGIVYRAEDTNLSRDVAIKVLPEQFTKDPQRLARFEREGKLLAQLNHPNIAAIYGLEEAEGVRFLALELVPGETLAERVAKGRLPVKEALEVCRQIAEGMEAAHEKGVIHRDLKPANVKVTPEGKVKILDFGLAKAFEGETPIADISHSPTLTEEMTRAGTILGTAAYMSPEQAKGKPVDKRADTFAFGCVLYELLTGKRAFEGETVTETLAKILEREPNWDVLPGAVPSTIRFLMSRCLKKDPGKRLQHIDGARILIEEALSGAAAASTIGLADAIQPARRLWPMAVGLVILTAIVAGLAVWLLIQPSSPEQPLNQFVITPPPSAPLVDSGGVDLTISPDGRRIIYVSQDGQLYLRSMDDPTVTPIRGTAGAITNMFFSPDGEWVAFLAGSELRKVSLAGGSSMTLSSTPVLRGGSWHAESGIVFSGAGGGLYQVSATGGEPELLAMPDLDKGELLYVEPEILPDGKAVVFTVNSGDNFHTAVLSLEAEEKKIVIEGGRQARYAPTGHLVYEVANTGTLMAAPFDLTQFEITGESAPILEGVRQTAGSLVDYAFSLDGTLAYIQAGSSGPHEHSLVWVDRQGRETLVTDEKRPIAAPRLSPDGKQVALSIGDITGRNVSIFDFETGSLSRLTFENERNGSPTWSPDGKWLIFQAGQVGGESGLVRQPVDRSRPQERLTSTPARQMTLSWSPDGQVVAFTESGRNGAFDIGILPLEGDGEPEFIIDSSAAECCPRFSPDGKWLAYVSNELGRRNVYISPYPEPEVEWLISEEDEGGEQPVWSPDGRELFYRSGNRMMVVSIQTRDQTLNAGKPERLFEGSYVSTHSNPPGFQYYDISPDGQRFLMLKEGTEEEPAQITVIQNWFEELKRLVPPGR